jgi:hypothetical protein
VLDTAPDILPFPTTARSRADRHRSVLASRRPGSQRDI